MDDKPVLAVVGDIEVTLPAASSLEIGRVLLVQRPHATATERYEVMAPEGDDNPLHRYWATPARVTTRKIIGEQDG